MESKREPIGVAASVDELLAGATDITPIDSVGKSRAVDAADLLT
jgi:hypothetical protein